LHEFSGPFGLKWGFVGKIGEGWCDVNPNKLVFTLGENRSRNATVRMRTDGQIHRYTYRRTDANGADNYSLSI